MRACGRAPARMRERMENMDRRQVSEERIARLRAAYAEAGCAAFFVRDVSNIRWATAFDGVFDSESAHALLVTGESACLHTDSRYVSACERASSEAGGVVRIDASRMTHAAFLAEGLSALGRSASRDASPCAAAPEGACSDEARDGRAGCDAVRGSKESCGIEDTVSVREYRQLEDALAEGAWRLRETRDTIVRLRAVKDADEISRMRAAQAITDAAFSHIVGYLRPGLTERDVQIELEDYLMRHGAEGLAFSSIVACGENGASPHAVPGDARLAAGQCVVLDFGARARGYCSDMTRTVFLGEPDPRMRSAYETIRRANEEVQAMLRPGVTGREAHEHAERVLAEGGFANCMGHGLGHGVGIDIHEEPSLSPRNEAALAAGNVVTVEPGIYLPGEFGMRLEDFGVVTPSGFDVFTQSTHDLVVL